MTKNWPTVPQYQGTMGHWVRHNKYIETLHILLHLIFICVILQKDALSHLQQNSSLAVQFVPLRVAEEGKITRFYTVPLSLLLRTKNVFLFLFRGTFIKGNFSNMYYKIPSELFSMNCS